MIAWLLLAIGQGTALACDAPKGGQPGTDPQGCATAPASTGSSSAVNLRSGNPINVITGNKYQEEIDMPALPGVLGLEVVRYYNSAYAGANVPPGPFGRGWRLSYDTRLHVIGNTLQIRQADGSRTMFARDPANRSHCIGSDPADGSLRIIPGSRGPDYVWTWTNGRQLSFDQAGRLVQILAPTGEFVSLQYDPAGYLLKVTDPQGRSLHVRYPPTTPARDPAHGRFMGVTGIDTPVGAFAFRYGAGTGPGPTRGEEVTPANLASVRSDTGARHYHYEDVRFPGLLTGISSGEKPSAYQRLSTWTYDANGLANMSVKGTPARWKTDHHGAPLQPLQLVDGTGIEQVTLDYSEGGKTLLTNSLGQVTVYQHAIVGGQRRLLEVRGAGCVTCGESNVRYAYDALGRLLETTRLDIDGMPLSTLRTQLDSLGRTLRSERIAYDKGRPLPAQLLVAYAYRNEPGEVSAMLPVRIIRPSLAPGKFHTTDLTYNVAGQATQITEKGWSPVADATIPPTSLERTTTMTYRQINGRSLLVMIRGPLADTAGNTPADIPTTDVRRLDWDAKGNAIVAVTLPGGFTSTISHDNAGRIGVVTDDEGNSTRFDYNSRDQLIATHTGGRTYSTDYDEHGNPVETGEGSGTDYKAATRSGFDIAGRMLWRVSTAGIVNRYRHDTEGNLVESGIESASALQLQQYRHDHFGRLTGSTDASGGTRTIAWNRQGLPDTMTDALGREQQYRYDVLGNVVEIIDAANVALPAIQKTAIRFTHDARERVDSVIAGNGATTRVIRDDFGRTVIVISADSGTSTRRFDAADRLVASIDANGNRASYGYDAAGRLVRQSVTDGRGDQTLTTWTYSGRRLVAVTHPGQSERYAYDGQGRLASRTVFLTLASGTQVANVTSYQHDRDGRLDSISLPDGSLLGYLRNAHHQVIAVERHRIRTPWLRWLLPSQTIVRDLERDAVGPRRLVYGNGMQFAAWRSKEGGLARIVHRQPGGAGAGRVDTVAAVPGMAEVSAAQSVKFPVNLPVTVPATVPTTMQGSPVSTVPGALPIPPDPLALLDHRYLWDLQGNLLHVQDKDAQSTYAYDAQDRLIIASRVALNRPADIRAGSDMARYFHDGTGNRLLSQEGFTDQSDMTTGTTKSVIAAARNRWQGDASGTVASYDPNGQPSAIGQRTYRWDAYGRLAEVRDAGSHLASYRYNHAGERISKSTRQGSTQYLYEQRQLAAELNDQGLVTRQYLYLADQPIALIDTPAGVVTAHRLHTPLRQVATDLLMAVCTWFSGPEAIAYLHNNHLGTTELITDDKARPVWRATYSPYGKIRVAATGTTGTTTGFQFNLRLPGQYDDTETGLYYNDHRYYDPQRGRYLTPDPLGLGGGLNGYAYVANNPLKFVDPGGLILFAFDGTNNSNPAPGVDDFSNVYKFFQAYDDGRKWYMNGVGRPDPGSGIETNLRDDKDANTARKRVDAMLGNLDTYMQTTRFSANEIVDIDIIGFSRGAAMARDFSNTVARRLRDQAYRTSAACLSIRFIGLWDTVAQFGLNGANNSSWQLAIPAEARYVFQAVALNEHRYWFPGESIGRGTQRGFIGSHADIGGSYGTGDLSDVALNWIVAQAKNSGVKLVPWGANGTDQQWGVVTNPVLHDKSIVKKGAPEDRQFCLRRNNQVVATDCETQRRANPGGMTWKQSVTGNFIHMASSPGLDADGASRIIGDINMKEYAAWLKQHYDVDIR